MNKKKTPNNIEDLLSLFSETLTPADVLSAKLMAQFSNAITSERLNLNMSQKDFAKHINATQSLISRWECGDYNFSINKIAEIAAKLDLNVDFKINAIHLQILLEMTIWLLPKFHVRLFNFQIHM